MPETENNAAQTPEQYEVIIHNLRVQLEDSEQEIVEINRRAVGLINSFAFDMRTPLTFIEGYTNLILYEEKSQEIILSEETKGFLLNIKRYVERLRVVVKDFSLLGYAFLEVEFPERVFLADILTQYKFVFINDPIELSPVLADPSTVSRVIQLVGFGLMRFLQVDEHTENDIMLSGESNNDCVTLQMYHHRYQGNDIEQFVGEETNLLTCDEREFYSPLCIANALINKMGGKMYVEIEKNAGTTVSFTLPIYKG